MSRQLIAAGKRSDTPVALIENATLPNERQFFTTLGLLPIASKTALGDGPALLLIGEAMRQRPASKSDVLGANSTQFIGK